MSFFKAFILSTRTKVLLKIHNPLYKTLCSSPSYIIRRTLSSSSQIPTKTPLYLLLQDTVLTVKPSGTETQSKGEINETVREFRNFKENPEGKKKEREKLDGKKPKKFKCLVEFVGDENKEGKMKKTMKVRRKREKLRALKGLSQLAKMFIRHLYPKGYFKEAGFVEDNKLDFGYFENSYGRDFIKGKWSLRIMLISLPSFWGIITSMTVLLLLVNKITFDFGICRWLPGSHLKKVVLFGCASLDKNNVFAAKRLRKFFKIQENTVCSRCMLKDSCEYANKSVWGIGTNSLLLLDVMKVITLYALDLVPAKLTVPDEVKDSINQLLKVVIKLSQPTCQDS
ncbi:Dysferlin [Gossypium australe]|uniref:Dysferlin n=1 Tax=Gossypium australe TaxID=47621 RepID=A0A5B6VTQ3_9ROSI|nr:Dysferlin [Gossypium australe]